MAKNIYLDNDYKCHVEDDGTFEVHAIIETDKFDNYCKEYIEGYRFVPEGHTWTRSDGVVFKGEMISPCKDWKDLIILQHTADHKILDTYKEALTTIGIII